MTLDEAIKHAKEKAQKHRQTEKKYREIHRSENDESLFKEQLEDCIGCAEEHEQLAQWLEELKEYKELEEQGLLKKFDCAIGDTVYRINSLNEIYECTVQGIRQEFNTTSYFLHANINEEDYSIWVDNWFDSCQIGHEFYLTKRNAEQELKRTESAE